VLTYNHNKKLSCRWQTARRICVNAMAWLTS